MCEPKVRRSQIGATDPFFFQILATAYFVSLMSGTQRESRAYSTLESVWWKGNSGGRGGGGQRGGDGSWGKSKM